VSAEPAATPGEVDGVPVTLRFADAEAEYRALRAAAGVVEQPWMDRLRVTGADRTTFLQGMLSNDVRRLAPGGGAPTLLLTDQGRVVADLTVLVTADAILLDGVAAGVREAEAALGRFIVADDVELVRAGVDHRVLRLAGATSAEVVARVTDRPLPAEPWAHAELPLAGRVVQVVRAPAPIPGFVLHASAADAAAVRAALVAAGAAPAGLDAWEVLRIEHGVPWWGRDVGLDHVALEAPYDAAISFAKGCYLGQEVMERVTARGHVNRKLTGLTLDGRDVPASGTRLFADDKDVGWITSAAWSWSLGAVAALGYVRREHLVPGTLLAAGAAGAARVAVVRGLPLVGA
jgi:folate-binding protein YgfZ